MEEKGLQEDPRYSQLLALRANSKQTHLNQNQMQLLRAQIMAYRSLARNQPLNKQIQSVIAGKIIKQWSFVCVCVCVCQMMTFVTNFTHFVH